MMSGRFRSLASVMAMLLLFSLAPPASGSQQNATGQVRVLLTEWSSENTLDIGVWGSYLMDEVFTFQRGAKIRLHEQQGRIMAYYEGMAYRGGKSIQLLRHQAEEGQENGLRLEQKLQLFEGDLFVTAVDGKLQVVLHIGIEDYLKGVVPYEMSDTFPLEALKAQAVAARTYTLKALRTDRAYDVVDNTNDQVFRGALDEQQKAQRAVKDTAGQTLVYAGQPANAYYTASNGGQTESAFHAWGREKIDYLQVKDDPYDAANPQAEVRKARLPKQITDSDALHPWLATLFHQAAVKWVGERGYDPNPVNVQVNGVMGVAAHTPQFSGDSRLMTAVRFELRVSARKPAHLQQEGEVSLFSTPLPTQSPAAHEATALPLGPMEPVLEPVVVDLPLYPDMERELGLSINVKQNETVTVLDLPDAFVLQTGRYGHGVGMSQRGAEWMAEHHGMSYQDILAFYYPGTTLAKYNTSPQKRGSLPGVYLSTPGPRPTATPRPTLVPVSTTPGPDQYVVLVTGVARNSSLNLRAQPNTNSEVLYQLFHGQKLLVVGRASEEWLEVQADGLKGYVMERFVSRE